MTAESPARSPLPPPAPASRATRVLLVDDHTLLRRGLRMALEDAGYEVVAEGADGAEAVRLATELHPDVVLMDLTMPVLDGIEATRRIGARLPELPIVMLTMHADGPTAKRALDAGAIGYLVKDCTADEVVAAIRLAADHETVISPDVAAALLEQSTERDHPTPADDASGCSAGEAADILSRREREVLQVIAAGRSTKEAARELYISVKTVKNHLASIYEKLDARDRTQAVLSAARLGIIRLP